MQARIPFKPHDDQDDARPQEGETARQSSARSSDLRLDSG